MAVRRILIMRSKVKYGILFRVFNLSLQFLFFVSGHISLSTLHSIFTEFVQVMCLSDVKDSIDFFILHFSYIIQKYVSWFITKNLINISQLLS